MNTKAVVAAIVGTQLILGLILIFILVSVQGQGINETTLPPGPIHVVVDQTPTPCTQMFGCYTQP